MRLRLDGRSLPSNPFTKGYKAHFPLDCNHGTSVGVPECWPGRWGPGRLARGPAKVGGWCPQLLQLLQLLQPLWLFVSVATETTIGLFVVGSGKLADFAYTYPTLKVTWATVPGVPTTAHLRQSHATVTPTFAPLKNATQRE